MGLETALAIESVLEQKDQWIVDRSAPESVRVWLADDEEAIRDLLRWVVKNEGYQVEKQMLTNHNRQLMETLQKKVYELNVLYDVSKTVNDMLDYEQLVDRVVSSLNKIIPCDIVASFLADSSGSDLSIHIARPVSAEMIERVKNRIAVDFSGLSQGWLEPLEKIKTRINMFDETLEKVPRRPEKPLPEDVRHLGSFLNVPLTIRNRVVGMIHIASEAPNAFTEEDRDLLHTVALQISDAMARLKSVIAEEKARIDAMVESMADGVIMTGERGQVVVMNAAARRLLGFTTEEAVTMDRLQERFGEMGARDIRVREVKPSDDGEKNEITIEVESKGYPPRTLAVHQNLVRNAESEPIGFVTILRDITIHKEIERMKDEFISTVSHELRTPLMIVKGAVSNLKDGIVGPLTEKQTHVIEMADRNLGRLSRIITDLLDLSRLESGRARMNRNRVDLGGLLQEVVRGFDIGGEDRRVELKLNVGAQLPDVDADPDMIVQVLNNLLSNAFRFAKSRIDVSAELCADDSVESRPSFVRVDVADDGPGIEPFSSPFWGEDSGEGRSIRSRHAEHMLTDVIQDHLAGDRGCAQQAYRIPIVDNAVLFGKAVAAERFNRAIGRRDRRFRGQKLRHIGD